MSGGIDALRVRNRLLCGLEVDGGNRGRSDRGACKQEQGRKGDAEAASRDARTLDRGIHERSLLMTMEQAEASLHQSTQCARATLMGLCANVHTQGSGQPLVDGFASVALRDRTTPCSDADASAQHLLQFD